jgi:hypothetical protein
MKRWVQLLSVCIVLASCSNLVTFSGDRKEPVVPVQSAPETKQVAAPLEQSNGTLTTLVRDGKALQYYALEPLATKVAFLTFDDFGSAQNLNEILTVLDTYGAKATFFINCRYLDPTNPLYSETYVRWMRRLQTKGHTIANHSYSHFSQGTYYYNYYRDNPVIGPDGKYKPPPNSAAQAYTYHYGYPTGLTMLRNEIDACDNILNAHKIPAYDPIFRPPYGEHVPLLDIALAQAGYSTTQVLNWDISTCDFGTNSTTALHIKDAIVNGVIPPACTGNNPTTTRPLRHSDVVLMHWSTNAANNTAEGLALALAELAGEFSFPALQNEATDY